MVCVNGFGLLSGRRSVRKGLQVDRNIDSRFRLWSRGKPPLLISPPPILG